MTAGRLSDIAYAKGPRTLPSLAYTRDRNGSPTVIDDSLAGHASYAYDGRTPDW